VQRNNSFGDLANLRPEDVLLMFGNLGPALQPLTQAFQVPGGIPLVTGSIDDAINFSLMLENFARGLYLSPTALGANEIGPTTGVLADDVAFVLVLENAIRCWCN